MVAFKFSSMQFLRILDTNFAFRALCNGWFYDVFHVIVYNNQKKNPAKNTTRFYLIWKFGCKGEEKVEEKGNGKCSSAPNGGKNHLIF